MNTFLATTLAIWAAQSIPAEQGAPAAPAAQTAPPASAEPPSSIVAAPSGAPPAAIATPTPLPPAKDTPVAALAAAPKKENWYEVLKLRGYTQIRYNRLPSFDRNDKLVSDQGDKSIGGKQGFLIRRLRLILSGDVHEQVSIYIQPDFASTVSGTEQLHTAILRDAYFDLALDKKREFRFRVGQSKVPYGFENLQSSQNRLALDRNDALNSAVKDERDLGVFFYWAPATIRERFKHLVDSGLKGSGDYGVLGLGAYNGQTANRPEKNDNRHLIGRLAYPFLFGEQYFELGGGGFYGKANVVPSGNAPSGEPYRTSAADNNLTDARWFGTIVLYPQPFGFQAEVTSGVGPAQSRSETERHLIGSNPLWGGYAQVMWMQRHLLGMQAVTPFARYTYYSGGKKFETNAPRYLVKELEAGLEVQIIKAVEIVGAYMIADRTSAKSPYEQEQGQVTRVQLQVNY